MANNPYVNKVIYGNDTVMDISDTTATEGDVISGKDFYKADGAKATGSAVIPDISNCYQTTDSAETDLADADYVPFYDSSASAKRKTLWSNIKSVLSNDFRKKLLGTFNGGGDSATYCLLCTLTVTAPYANYPIEIVLQERGCRSIARLYVFFTSVNSTDPSVVAFSAISTQNQYYIYKSDTSTWQIFVQKNESYSLINVVDYSGISQVSITWNLTNYTGDLPTGYVQATNILPKVVDNLTSTSTTDALSANQGKQLKDTAYLSDDTTETTIDNADYFPFYDTSATAKKKSTWSNIVDTLKSSFSGVFYSNTDSLYSGINDSDHIPYSTNTSPTTRAITFSGLKNAVLEMAENLLKHTVGWIGNNLADMSKAELGVGIFGSSDDTKARLAIPVESSKTYYASISGTNAFNNIRFTVTNTATPTSGIVEGGTFPITLSIGASDTYVVFEFGKSTTVTQSDLTALQFMISEKSLDTYNDYHKPASEFFVSDVKRVYTGTITEADPYLQNITVTKNGSNSVYWLDGLCYMQKSANSATFTFQSNHITASSVIDVYTNTWGDNPSNVTASSGSCTVTFPSAKQRTVGINIVLI